MASQASASGHNGRMAKAKSRWLVWLLLLLGIFAVGAVQAKKPAAKQLQLMLHDYSSSIRWSEFETAWSFVDPVFRDEHPLSDFDLEHYLQFQVSGYLVKSTGMLNPQTYGQVVEVRLINRHTQVEKVIIEHELWRWDPVSKHWWLTTGLPKLTQH